MDSSQTEPQTTESLSSPTPLPAPDPAPASPAGPPPLGVKTGQSIPSPTTPSPDYASASPAADPVDSTSTHSSAAEPSAVKLNTKALTELARGVVLTVSLYIHSTLARTELEKAQSVWVADEEDQAQIADPLAGLLGAKGLAAAVVNPETKALIEAGLGAAAYVVKNVKKALAARRQAKQQTQFNGGITNATTGEPA